MVGKHNRPEQAAELRRQAEKIAREKDAQSPEDLEALSPEATRQTLHELRVHQIELEMQNEELRRAQAELDAAWTRYFDLYDLAPVGYCTLSEPGLMILEANLTTGTLLGVARGALVEQPISPFIFPEDQDLYYRHRKQLFETGEPQACELRMLKNDGTAFWARLEANAAQDEDGEPVCRLMMSDVTERKRAEEALRESEERFKNLFMEAPLGIALIDSLTGQVDSANPMFAKIAGRTMEEMAHIDSMSITHPEDVQEDLDNMALLNAKKIPGFQMEKRYVHPDGTSVWINMTIASVYVEDKAHPLHLCMIEDISRRKLMEAQLKEASIHDTLTGLYNHRLFEEEMARLYRGRRFPVSIVMADLNRLKETNDRDGHAAGDALLRRAAGILSSAFRAEDIIARIGGDEFAVLLPDTDAVSAGHSVRRVRRSLRQHNAACDDTPLSIAFGFSTAEQGVALTDALKEADARMYEDKRGV